MFINYSFSVRVDLDIFKSVTKKFSIKEVLAFQFRFEEEK